MNWIQVSLVKNCLFCYLKYNWLTVGIVVFRLKRGGEMEDDRTYKLSAIYENFQVSNLL